MFSSFWVSRTATVPGMKPYYLNTDDAWGLMEPCTALLFTIGLFIYSIIQVWRRTILFFTGAKEVTTTTMEKKKKKVNTEALWSKRLALSVAFLAYVLRPLYIDKNGLAELIRGSDPKL